jgi:hypothetical protein
MGRAMLGASLTMWYRVGRGLIGVVLSSMMAMGVGSLSLIQVVVWCCCVGAC